MLHVRVGAGVGGELCHCHLILVLASLRNQLGTRCVMCV